MCDYDGVGGLYDFVEVFDGLVLFEFGDDWLVVFVGFDFFVDCFDVGSIVDVGCGDVVCFFFDCYGDVVVVFF